MNGLKYRLYCLTHHIAKKILRKTTLTTGNILHRPALTIGTQQENAVDNWKQFIFQSAIPSGDFHNMLFAGYVAENNTWCLPSWIWTNAAVVREACDCGNLDFAKTIAKGLAERQQKCGGWIVRNDYDKHGAIPMLAPNDSAYIANNAFLTLYEQTKEEKYLIIAKRCADWIIETARPDGMVYVGYNMRDEKWDKNCVIVDVGFTAGLFARLVEITHEEKYFTFLRRFTKCYVELFYIHQKHGFCTSIDKNNRQQGGMFARGQAWALEGLIPAYKVLKNENIKQVIEETIDNLLSKQLRNGGWSYNFSKPLLGEDCKAVSVIAKDMMEWYKISNDERIRKSASKALDWCCKHTAIEGEATGGIFSFCMEGAIVQNLYTSCAFVYSSAYAIELYEMLKQ